MGFLFVNIKFSYCQVEKMIPMFSSKIFMVLSFIFRTILYFINYCVWYEVGIVMCYF